MTTILKTIVDTLNDLIETCRNGEKGYQEAAANITDDELRGLFEGYVSQRSSFVYELRKEMLRLGAEPEDQGSMLGALHRGWIDLKSMASFDDGAILSECERGENHAVNAYAKALNEDLPVTTRAVVERQYAEIKDAHDLIKTLRDSLN